MKLRSLYTVLLALCITSATVWIADSATAAQAPAAAAAKKKKTSASKKKSSTRTKKTNARKSTKKKVSTKKVTPKKTSASQSEPVLNDSLTLSVNDALLRWIPSDLNPGGLRVNSVRPNPVSRTTAVSLNENFTYLPVTRQLIDSITRQLALAMPDSISGYRINVTAKSKPLSYYITTVEKLPEKFRANVPFVVDANPSVRAPKGMQGDIVALWHSHGRYFKNSAGGWMWQRPLLFGTTEDTFTMGFILPYAVPMLENAGAYVMLPRERDINPNEVIVDNDTNPGGMLFSQPNYREHNTRNKKWQTGEGDGFIYDLPDFRDTENPFENGTYRQVETTRNGKDVSLAAWYADIPADGEYAVYVSYKSLPNSTKDAHYTVNYSGGSQSFRVNQTMGGGTWIYLGTYPLEEGFSDTEPIVVLSNLTEGDTGTVVTADAVKIGGGMGNIARSPRRSDVWYDPSTPESQTDAEEEDAPTDDPEATGDLDLDTPAESSPSTPLPQPARTGQAPKFTVSGMPRYLEGARYWLHWAGAPEDVYSPTHGTDDYKDDYTSRGNWVNWLAGGSRVLPDADGLGIPVDVAFALHSDAGKRADDSYVGTLGIYYTNNGDNYTDGSPRSNSRTLTDMVMRQITSDIRREWEPSWTRRSMWDKSYVEARVPEVPTTLIELLSHQNFADMRLGLDPSFRFTVGRAIYKALARFVSERKGREVVIQPLPVKDFAIQRTGKRHYRLSWNPRPDALEPTAMPNRYIILERTDDELGWHWLGETRQTHFDLEVEDHDIHSYRIIAANDGGRAFPSETLALREANDYSDPIMVVNGFDRIAGPEAVNSNGNAGFDFEQGFGVPYIRDISYTGAQTEFRRSAGESHGRSQGNMATVTIAGNTFDYPYLHGLSIAAAGHGFVSASAASVENGTVKLNSYPVVDLILGRQRATVTGRGQSGTRFQAFPAELRKALTEYSEHGGDLIVSGQYVAEELFGMRASDADRSFGAEVLGIAPGLPATPAQGKGRMVAGQLEGIGQLDIDFSSTLNPDMYIVTAPDAITPAQQADAVTIATAGAAATPAGVLARRNGKPSAVTLTIPFETITDRRSRDLLMKSLLQTLRK